MKTLYDNFRYDNMAYYELEEGSVGKETIDGFVEKLKGSPYEEPLLNSVIIMNYRGTIDGDWITDGTADKDYLFKIIVFLKPEYKGV